MIRLFWLAFVFTFLLRGQQVQAEKPLDRIKEATAEIRLNPYRPFAYNTRASQWKKLGKHKLAIIDFTKSAQLWEASKKLEKDASVRSLINRQLLRSRQMRAETWLELKDYRMAMADYCLVARMPIKEYDRMQRRELEQLCYAEGLFNAMAVYAICPTPKDLSLSGLKPAKAYFESSEKVLSIKVIIENQSRITKERILRIKAAVLAQQNKFKDATELQKRITRDFNNDIDRRVLKLYEQKKPLRDPRYLIISFGY